MCAVLHGISAGGPRGAAPVGWRSVPELRHAGVASREANLYSDTLAPRSWFADVLTFGCIKAPLWN